MRIRRTLPPAAAPIGFGGLWGGIRGSALHDHRGEMEQQLRSYFGVRHAVLLSSGTAALAVILRALASLSPGRDEVLIPAFTCFSVPSAVVREGLSPTLCDIDPGTLDFEPASVKQAITSRTLCVIPTHLFGIPANISNIKNLCREHGAYVVEDAAQAFGVRNGGRLLGTNGDVGFLSFGRGKHLSAGSGGAVLTDTTAIASAVLREVSRLPDPGILESARHCFEAIATAVFIRPSLYWLPDALTFLRLGESQFNPGFPITRLSRARAGLLHGWRRRLEDANRRRTANVARLMKALGAFGPREPAVPFLRLPVLAASRSERDSLARLGKPLGVSTMYPTPVNEIPEIATRFAGLSFQGASKVAELLLAFPTHPLLGEDDLKGLEAIVGGLRGGSRFRAVKPKTFLC